jgi:hypothetical protein
MASVFGGIIEFFGRIGIYDVVLPFLLVFTIVFAILEKTRVLGTDTINGTKYTKKNLNAMVAFVVAFMVLASANLVQIITQVSSQMVILLLLSVFFLLLVGSFYTETEEPFFLEDRWKLTFTIIMFLGIVAIFLMAIRTPDGTPWLQWFFGFIIRNATGTVVATVLLLLIVIGGVVFVVYEP